jgi:hypothetical protein
MLLICPPPLHGGLLSAVLHGGLVSCRHSAAPMDVENLDEDTAMSQGKPRKTFTLQRNTSLRQMSAERNENRFGFRGSQNSDPGKQTLSGVGTIGCEDHGLLQLLSEHEQEQEAEWDKFSEAEFFKVVNNVQSNA